MPLDYPSGSTASTKNAVKAELIWSVTTMQDPSSADTHLKPKTYKEALTHQYELDI
jgi:hypothetical protein